jgi:hypothetical protein
MIRPIPIDAGKRSSQKAMPATRTRLHGRYLIAGLAVLGGVVLFNALALQKERHPAPMFQPIIAQNQPAPLPAPSPAPPRKDVASAPRPSAPAPVSTPAAAQPAPSSALPVMIEKAALSERITATEKPRLQPVPPVSAESADPALLLDLQRELARRGHYKGELDGKSGPMMVQAIRSFQFSQRVAVDGKPSEALLREVRATKIPAPTPPVARDELLDLLRKTTPETKAGADKAGRAQISTPRNGDRAG